MINGTSQLIQEKAFAYDSSLIFLWAIILIVFPLTTLIFKSKKTNWGKFWVVFIFTAIISGIALVFLIFSPHAITSSLNYIKGFFLT